MSINHVILLSFKPDTGAETIEKACSGFLALKDDCLHATTQAPYIKSLTGGINNSEEGLHHGFTHGFVLEFNSAEDREHYIKQDPVHRTLLESALPIIDKICVLDYTPGLF
ncbi:stress responsive A/B barrel domain-containing protein [Trichoderma ceciliae]